MNSGPLTVEYSPNHVQYTASNTVHITTGFSGVQIGKVGSDSNSHLCPQEAVGQDISLVLSEQLDIRVEPVIGHTRLATVH